MSGHSKWATTKARKSAVDSKRSNLFAKLSKNITLAAKRGGDIEMNFSLRMAVDKAKSANMPKENIDRAIKRGTGEIGGAVIEEVTYEAFGPDGLPLLIIGVTDNKNRTTSDVKAILNKNNATFGAQNTVQWMFEKKGVIYFKLEPNQNKEDLILEFIDFGADDVVDEYGGLAVYCAFEKFEKLKRAVEDKGFRPEYAEVEWVAKENVEAAEDVRGKMAKLVEALEEHDDINTVYTNLK